MKLRFRRLPDFLLPAVAGFCLLAAEAVGQKIVIVTADTLTSTQRSVSGVKSVIRSANPKTGFVEILLNPADPQSTQLRDSIRTVHPDLIVTTGTDATQFAKANFTDLPIVFSSVMYPVVSGFVETFNRPGGNVTGASLSIPPRTQFEYFKTIIPNLKTIGVLYTGNTASMIPPAQVVARSCGLELVALRVDSEKDLAARVDSITKVVQGLWSLADPSLFTPQSTKYILINALRRGTPLMGFSRILVESGALFALDFDYKAVGRQAGEIACQILKGASPANISVTTPDIVWFHYNEKTAQHMAIKMPDSLVAIAKEVYR